MIVELDHRLFLKQDYAIINPMQIGQEQYADLDTKCLMPRGLERHQRMMPLLVHLAGTNAEQRIELLERGDLWGRRHDMPLFSALLESPEPVERVRPHLLRSMFMARSGSGKVWLRIHDPRVFGHLCWIFNDEQMAGLMGPIHAWSWFDPLSREWHRHVRPDIRQPPKLRPSEDQWRRVDQLEALNHCLKTMAEENAGVPDEPNGRRLSVALSEAAGLGLKDLDDLAIYVRQSLDHGPGFDRSETVRRRLATMAREGTSYQGASSREATFVAHDNGNQAFEGESA